MLLQHFSNGYVAKTLFQSSLPKVQDDDQAATQFKEGFKLSRKAMKFAGLLELIGSIFLFISIISKSGKKIYENRCADDQYCSWRRHFQTP